MQRSKMPHMKEFAQKLIKELGWEANPTISAIFIIGSVALGHDDSMSDLDLVIVADPSPSYAFRYDAYQRIGCRKVMIGFFQKNSPVLDSNVAVIDKIWINDFQIDICFCTEGEVSVYNYQPIVTLKSSTAVEGIQPAVRVSDNVPHGLEDRLRYDFRILEVHRDRYDRWCRRKQWVNVDLSKILLAVRDIVLVLNGHWQYNAANPYFWMVLEDVEVSVPNLSKTLEDIKELDDRIAFRQKLGLIDALIADLKRLCLSQGVNVRLYDIDNKFEGLE